MPSPTNTTVDLGSPLLDGEVCRDELLTFTGATTYKAGTILARDSSTLKLIAFVKGGSTNGNGVVKAVLPYDVTSAGAGDIKVRAAIFGRVNKKRLIILADGDDSNIDGAVIDGLRAYGLTPVDVLQTSS